MLHAAKSLSIFAFLFFVISSSYGQGGFHYVSNTWGIQLYNVGPYFGGGVSFHDFTGDGLDDLTFCVNNDSIVFFVNVGNDYERDEIIPNTDDAKMPTWVDYDNDGDDDLFITKNEGPCKLYRNDGYPVFTDVSADMNLPVPGSFQTFGCSWGDYDNDSWLDVYICNYNWGDGVTNWLMHNNGDGTFTNTATALGVSNGSKPSFQSVWIDINFDGWLDLYVINDKFQVNAFYLNTGSGTFIDVSAATGTNIMLDAMCNSWSDMDNDGDFDVFVTNTAGLGNKLLKNNDGIFEEIAEEAGVQVFMLCWGGLWIDFDNNLWDDLHVANSDFQNGNQNYFFINNQDNTFTDMSASLGLANDDYMSYATAKGDINNDGYYDFIETNISPVTAALWLNDGFTNNYLKLGLTGVVSNRDGIGTYIEYWVNGQRYIRQTMCGGNYISQNSQYEILALDEFTQVDSLALHWPSGWVDIFTDVEANQFLLIEEGASINAGLSYEGNGLCEGGSLVITAGEFESYEWSTEETTSSITVTEPGIYWVTVTNEFGLSATTEIEIPLLIPGAPEIIMEPASCNGYSDGSINLSLVEGEVADIIWSNGADSTQVSGLAAGIYTFSLHDEAGCIITGDVMVEQPDSIEINSLTTPVTCNGGNDGTAILEISGGTADYSADWQGEDPGALEAGTYEVIVTDANNCVATILTTISEPEAISATFTYETVCFGESTTIEAEITGGNGNYQPDWNGIDTTEVFAGTYTVDIVDGTGCTASIEYVVNDNPELTATQQVINANNGDNGSVLLDVSGGMEPYTYEWTTGSETEVASNLGQGTYVCLVTDALGCTMLVEVSIIDISIDENNRHQFLIYPNPVSTELTIAFNLPREHFVFIENVVGQRVHEKLFTGNRAVMDVSFLAPGLYFVRVSETVRLFEKR